MTEVELPTLYGDSAEKKRGTVLAFNNTCRNQGYSLMPTHTGFGIAWFKFHHHAGAV